MLDALGDDCTAGLVVVVYSAGLDRNIRDSFTSALAAVEGCSVLRNKDSASHLSVYLLIRNVGINIVLKTFDLIWIALLEYLGRNQSVLSTYVGIV
jgi:hypothetical protein